MVTAPRPIPDAVRATQARASDPTSSAFVSANAGSGKTHVLVQRVIRLLLDNVPPEKILCITFTKAAAANMAKRVFDTLGRWTTLDDDALDAAIGAPPGRMPGARRAQARRLFARALDTPGGLKVQTIHAFCTQLLHQFPFEANVAARFTVLDETAQMQLLEELTLAALLLFVARCVFECCSARVRYPWREQWRSTRPKRAWIFPFRGICANLSTVANNSDGGFL